ncbi:hypothetical protein, partial [Azoarcus taiwanensis]|uniref:hypothetical protein n=1 Tax=Azoarcus taiwanensis TaxID=666964 RepID=UPI001B7CF19F
QVGLDGGAFLHGWRQRTKSGQSNFTNHRGAEVFRGALKPAVLERQKRHSPAKLKSVEWGGNDNW